MAQRRVLLKKKVTVVKQVDIVSLPRPQSVCNQWQSL